MAAEKPDKSVQFIAKLVQLTQDKKITWDSVTSPRPGDDKVARAEFVTTIDESKIRIFETSREVANDSFAVFIVGANASKTRIVRVPILEVLDDQGRVTYTFEGKTGLRDLYESAAYSASKVDDLMDAVLRKK